MGRYRYRRKDRLKMLHSLPVNRILDSGIDFHFDKRFQNFEIRIEKNTIWRFPKDFAEEPFGSSGYAYKYDSMWGYVWYDLYALLKAYMDCPREKIFDLELEKDHFGVKEILLAGDRRLGQSHLHAMMFSTDHAAALKIIQYRLMGLLPYQ